MSKPKTSFLFLLLGAGLFVLVTWRWNVALASWLAPIFLIRFFRSQRRWPVTLLAIPLLWAGSYANKLNAWDMEPALFAAASLLAAGPLIAALYLDRFSSRRLSGIAASLVFPAVYVTLDYALSFLPFGTVFSLGVTQFYSPELIQIGALAGIWGIEFLVLWAAPVFNAWWEAGFDLRLARLPLALYAVCLAAALLYGGLRLTLLRPVSPTVRVAGIAVEHPRPYWDELIDRGTPQGQAQALAHELSTLEDHLFEASEAAVRSGAQVVFWSEANAMLLPERKPGFLARAQAFAQTHQVYFLPAYQVLRYGDTSGDNQLAMITPGGEIAYFYTKTKSWYATDSDGILHSVVTPYGRIGAAICFDMDFPSFIRQAAEQRVDIMLDPSFDTYLTRLYHSEVGLLRGVEDGFSVMRMVNEGTSMAVDYRGRVLAAQDFFLTPERILVADLPTRGVGTLYGRLGDYLAWLSITLCVGLVGAALLRSNPAAEVLPAERR